MKKVFILLTIFLSAFILNCKESPNAPKGEPAEAKRYKLKGKVISVDKPAKTAKIKHEDIANYMPAMTMDFKIKEDWVLSELDPADEVQAELVVTGDEYHLENIGIIEAPDGTQPPLPEQKEGKAREGADVPDFKLTNQDGKRFSFSDFKGKAWALTFIYTRCPLPDQCPRLSISFSDAERKIRENEALKDKVKLLSVSIDPNFDKPEVLKKYGLGYFGKDAKSDFSIWNLATGTEKEVADVTEFFGLYAVPNNEGKFEVIHSMRTAIITPEGKVKKVISGSSWTGNDLVQGLEEATQTGK